MWDLDASLATPETVEALLKTFIEKNGHIFQGNATPVEDMIDRKSKAYTKLYMDSIDELKREPTLFENPELFATPIVRNGKAFTLGFCPEVWKTWE